MVPKWLNVNLIFYIEYGYHLFYDTIDISVSTNVEKVVFGTQLVIFKQ